MASTSREPVTQMKTMSDAAATSREVAASVAPRPRRSSAGLRFLRPRKVRRIALVDDVLGDAVPHQAKADEADRLRARRSCSCRLSCPRMIDNRAAVLQRIGGCGMPYCLTIHMNSRAYGDQNDEADHVHRRQRQGRAPCRAVSGRAGLPGAQHRHQAARQSQGAHADHRHHRQRAGVQRAVELYGPARIRPVAARRSRSMPWCISPPSRAS